MPTVAKSVLCGFVLLVFVAVAVPGAYADDLPSPPDPPEARIHPPGGFTSQARISPPGGFTAPEPEARITPPGGVTSPEPGFFALLVEWLRAQARIQLARG